ncbi:MAG: dihydroorotase, partial [Devosiaceae bacterium]|nr:dihydroorotase [Devosiaceae bacterium]
MSNYLLIKNARIIDPASNKDEIGAILVKKSKIVDIISGQAPNAPQDTTIIDAKGLVLAPGLIDTRVFTGEPGHEFRETLSSASKAAAAGGVTSFVTMPDTSPIIDDAALVDFIIRRAKATAKVNILPSAAMTKGLNGKDISEYGLLKQAGAVCFSDGRRSVSSTTTLKSAFTYAKNFNMPIINHLLDEGLGANGDVHAGLMATGLGLKGIPYEAETIPLERDLQLAALTKVRYHGAQISCANSVKIIERHKKTNKNISCGVSINNLSLNENDVGSYRTFFKLSPPLRSEIDRQALIAGLNSGAIDIIHSDHDPQDVEGKRRPFAEAANGAIGLETLLSAALRLYHSEQVDMMTILRAMTINPAKLLKLKSGRLKIGAKADMILINLNYPFVVKEQEIISRSHNSVFERAKMTGKVVKTFV